MDCRQYSSLTDSMKTFQNILQRYPTCLAYRCLAFEPSETQTDNIKGLIMIPTVGDAKFYLQNIINDLTADILLAFGSLVYFH
jgi:hypothetical protein